MRWACRRSGGSGLLTAYLAGLAIGDARVTNASVVRGFMQGAAWLSQLALFVLLGLLVGPDGAARRPAARRDRRGYVAARSSRNARSPGFCVSSAARS